jgi:hypothetical protein
VTIASIDLNHATYAKVNRGRAQSLAASYIKNNCTFKAFVPDSTTAPLEAWHIDKDKSDKAQCDKACWYDNSPKCPKDCPNWYTMGNKKATWVLVLTGDVQKVGAGGGRVGRFGGA